MYQFDKEEATLADYVNKKVKENEEESQQQVNYISYGGNNVYGNKGQPKPYYGNNNQTYYRGPLPGYYNQYQQQ